MASIPTPKKADGRTQLRAAEIPYVLDGLDKNIKILSLDCFDTLLWRMTAAPKDVLSVFAGSQIAKDLGVTPEQRVSAAVLANRIKFTEGGARQIHISDIYNGFAALPDSDKAALIEAELQAEISTCFAFYPCVDLIRKACERGIQVIIVSDIYYRESELRRLLEAHLPADAMNAIDRIYTSIDLGVYKSEGLFSHVLKHSGVSADAILHIGDNRAADFDAPRQLGIQSLHFLQFDQEATDFLRMQNAASSLAELGKAQPQFLSKPRYSPFRPVLSHAELQPYRPETVIGYMTFGPLLYGYARFLTDEVAKLRQNGKRVKVFFLLRDAYLLARACEAYAGEPVGGLLRIRKSYAIAASFRTREDIDYYISTTKPEHFNYQVIVNEMLLPHEVGSQIIRQAFSTPDPFNTFLALVRKDEVESITLKAAAIYRERLKRYFLKEVQPQEGDVIMLADNGYLGSIQDFLARAFEDEFKIKIVGRYIVSNNNPNRPGGRSLITTNWCDHTLLEQSSTLKEGMVTDYTPDGEPILESPRLSDEQYQKSAAIQAECIRFIRDAKEFFDRSGITHNFHILQETAHAALFRHLYMPTEMELDYFKCFQHDKDMGEDSKKRTFCVARADRQIKNLRSPYRLHAYETRALSLDLSLSALAQRGLQLELTPGDIHFRFVEITIVSGKGPKLSRQLTKATYLYDGYYLLAASCTEGESFGVAFGEHNEWIQIEKIEFLDSAGNTIGNAKIGLICNEMKQHGSLYECLSRDSLMMIKPVASEQSIPHHCQIVFRPLVKRESCVS